MSLVKHFNITVFGKVQGVGFRNSARSVATTHQLLGYVKNIPGDAVYIEVEGEALDLQLFAAWCRKGPAHAQVIDIQISESEVRNYSEFKILY